MSTPIISLEQISDLYKLEQDRLFEILLRKLSSDMNVFLIADPGWGLKEYVNELGLQLTEKSRETQTCYLDMRSAYSPASFLELFVSALLQRFPEETSCIEIDRTSMDALRLPEFIAKRRKNQLMIFVANAHLFSRFKDPVPFFRTLKQYLRVQKNCVYCFYGKKNPKFKDLYNNSGSLHGFGQLHELNHNPDEHRSGFIRKLFHDHQKRIGYSTSVKMAMMMENHPFYIKLLAWHSLIMTRDTCTPVIVEKSLHNLILHFEYEYNKIAERLTQKQLYYLKALMDGNQKLYSSYTREAYQLGSTSNVASITNSLERRELIRIGRYETVFTDPIFMHWLRSFYFTEK